MFLNRFRFLKKISRDKRKEVRWRLAKEFRAIKKRKSTKKIKEQNKVLLGPVGFEPTRGKEEKKKSLEWVNIHFSS